MPSPVMPCDSLLEVGADVHAGGVPPDEERLVALVRRSMKSSAASRNSSSTVSIRFLVSGPVSSIRCLPTRPNRGSRSGRPSPSPRSAGRRAGRTARGSSGVLRVVRVLRLLLGVEVVEVAEELVEAVHGRQELVAVAEVVLAELPGGVAERLEQVGDGRVLGAAGRSWRPAARPWSGRCGSATGR